jgi:hypothetical protein
VKIGDEVRHLPGIAEALGRGDNACELCRSTLDLEASHRLRRSQGGEWVPANILCLCARCHSWCHAHPRYAERGGWFVRSAVDVDLTTERVWLQGRSLYLTGWCTLTLDGRWTWLGSDDPAPEMPASARAVAVVR